MSLLSPQSPSFSFSGLIHITLLRGKIIKANEFVETVSSTIKDCTKFSEWVISQMKSHHDEAVFEYNLEIKTNESEIHARKATILKTRDDFLKLERCLMSLAERKNFELRLPKFPKEKNSDLSFVYEFCYLELLNWLSERTIRENCDTIYEFLGVSVYSFFNELSPFYEGLILRETDTAKTFCSGLFQKKTYKKQWMMVTKQGFGFCESNSVTKLNDHLIFDTNYRLLFGKTHTGHMFGLNMGSSSRSFKLKAVTYLDLVLWIFAIQDAMNQSPYLNINKFLSCFPVRNYCSCKCLMEGKEYFAALEREFNNAKHEILISSASFSPEIYLMRPITQKLEDEKHRLDHILKNVANKGVKVYIVAYNEPSIGLQNKESMFKYVGSLHSNIKVVRSPDNNMNISLWRFNEKFSVIDRTIAFIGGPDLSFGQWDTQNHLLSDPEYNNSGNQKSLWPGKDYKNPRIPQLANIFQDQKQFFQDPRMPVHSVGVQVEGVIVFDLVRHFVQTWNFLNFGPETLETLLKRYTKFSNNNFEKSLARVIEYTESKNMTCSQYTDRDVLGKMIKRAAITADDDAKKESIYPSSVCQPKPKPIKVKALDQKVEPLLIKPEIKEHEDFDKGNFRCQLLRSANNWSLGLNSVDNSIQNCYLELILSAKHFIYIENQYFISNNANKEIRNLLIEAFVLRIKRAALRDEKFKIMLILPLIPNQPGKLDQNEELLFLEQNIYKTISHGLHSLVELLKKDLNIRHLSDYISFFGLRTHAKLQGVPVTEEIYINSNLMIIDDRIVVLGSANLNDRSLLGSRDAELCLILEDLKKIEGSMAGNVVNLSRFAHNLRVHLFMEHFSLEESLCQDPLNQELQKLIASQSRKNTVYYREIFRVWPDDNVRRLDMLDLFTGQKKMNYYEVLAKKIKGFAVDFPLKWLADEYLEKNKGKVPTKCFF